MVKLIDETEDASKRSSPDPSGQVALFGGVGAANADMGTLMQAQALSEQGADANDIWQTTGWQKGDEGKWRFEIDDSEAGFQEDGTFKHDRLTEAYPSFFDDFTIEVRDDLGPNRAGSFDKDTGTITVSSELTPEEQREVVLHESQHAIQVMEGFGEGASLNNKFVRMLTGVDNPTFEQLYDVYKTISGEVEARNAVFRDRNLTEEQRQVAGPDITTDVKDSVVILTTSSSKYRLTEQ